MILTAIRGDSTSHFPLFTSIFDTELIVFFFYYTLDSLDSIKMIAGSPIDPNSSAVRVAVDDHDKENAAGLPPYNPDQYKSFMGDEQVPHTGPLSAALNQSNVRQQLFDFSGVLH